MGSWLKVVSATLNLKDLPGKYLFMMDSIFILAKTHKVACPLLHFITIAIQGSLKEGNWPKVAQWTVAEWEFELSFPGPVLCVALFLFFSPSSLWFSCALN